MCQNSTGSVKIFFENKTTTKLSVIDTDNTLFGKIPPGRKVVLNLNFSQDFNKKYNLFIVERGISAYFFLNVTSELAFIDLNTVNGLLKLTITNEGNPKLDYTPPNKLIIEAVNGSSIRIAPPSLIPPTSDALLNANFY